MHLESGRDDGLFHDDHLSLVSPYWSTLCALMIGIVLTMSPAIP